MYAQPSRIVAEREWTMRAAGPSLDSLLVRPELTLWRQTSNLKQVRGPDAATLVCSTTASAASLIPRNRTSSDGLSTASNKTVGSGQSGNLRHRCRQCATAHLLTRHGVELTFTARRFRAPRPHQDSSTALCARVCIVHMPARAMSCNRPSLRALC